MAPIPILLKRAETEPAVSEIDPNLLLGSLEIGIFISTMLFGALMLEGGTFWRRRKDVADNNSLRLLVAVLLILELGHSLACMGTVYYFTVTLSGQALKPGSSYSFSIALVFGTSIIALVQTFYVYRCYLFSKNLTLSLIGYSLVLIHVACTFWLTYQSWLASTNLDSFELQMDYDWLITLALGGKAVVDVYAAGTLCWFLQKSLGTKPCESTARLVKRIAVWTIETGLLTSVASITVLICFQLMKFNYVWIAIYLSLTKLYSIALIETLNRRKMYRKQYTSVDASSITLPQSSIRFRSKTSSMRTVLSSRPSSLKLPIRRWTDTPRSIPSKLAASAVRRSTLSF